MGLRWLLGGLAAIVAAGWVALAAGGNSFRRSFGASENAPWVAAVPPIIALVVLASVVWPERRPLLHVTAALIILVLIASALLARQTVFVAALGVLYALAWLWFYYRAAWAGTAGLGAGADLSR
ncbi:MAG: hypothetical protein WKG32_16310 [Gemmatimonadaceae bacterium]